MESLYELIPHREPMMLLGSIASVGEKSSSAEIVISPASSFYVEGKGVPSWIGVEYMGQTAALIAGYQLKQGITTPHIGLLLGTRKYEAFSAWFNVGDVLIVSCQEFAIVGEQLATFLCEIHNKKDRTLLATAKLSVFRKPIV
ncbi:MAG: 3-hydroxylacyl-ACP dehydratase [Moraxellaceae bacterium]|nr:MAG: 3-hydroxylacyl-ACP dehydratase [Moraxellaceae bacterium]